jgi:hypothetical protein
LHGGEQSPERRRCVYCGIDSAQLYSLNVLNPRTKRRYEVIGVDRIDNDQPYDLANLVPCCPLCNQIKSQLLSYEEMRTVGSEVRRLWDARLTRIRARGLDPIVLPRKGDRISAP